MTGPLWKRLQRSETYLLLKREGAGRAISHIWRRLRNSTLSSLLIDVSGYIAEVDLRHPLPLSNSLGKDLHGSISLQHLAPHESLPPFCYGITGAEIKKRNVAGHRCYVLKKDDQIVCSCWIGFGTVSYGGTSIYLYSNHPIFNLAPGQGWLYDEICEENYREKGLGTIMMRGVVKDLKKEGVIRLTATVGADNIANIKVLLKTGFTIKEAVRYRRWLIFRYRQRKILNFKDMEYLRRKFDL
ncbi:MAG: GNAT family N-acetyltransferase [Syntrophobacterales bacterium]|nr:GNAT family N-acetyltransferase [Syntrophobacterales bacterium]